MRKLVFFIFTVLSLQIQSQTDIFLSLVPEPKYNTSSFHNFFFGSHWRNIWNSEIDFKIIDYTTFSGGLTPTKKGGGFQTKSLRFLSKNGIYWKFRSLKKDPSKVLPKELQETFVADILYDQIAAAHPTSPLVIAEFLDHFQIANAKPIFVFLKSDSVLGEFQNEYGDLFGTFEIHPDDDDSISFPQFDKIDGTFDIFHRLDEKRDESFDAAVYLKARLLDIYFGDWDRHTDQWRWGRIKNQLGKDKWVPIPRDRDQVFSLYDGILPSIVEYYIPQITSFRENLPDLNKITWSGRFLDRRILPLLNKSEWDSVTALIYNGITDSLINFAVSKLPPSHYKASSDYLIKALKQRKTQLLELSDDYYSRINSCIDIYCSAKDDIVEISANQTDFNVIVKKTKSNEVIIDKSYLHYFTDEVRIHLNDGDDKVIIRGNESDLPKIRVIGDEGKDSVINLISNISPFSLPNVVVYDSGKKTFISVLNGISFNSSEYPVPKDDFERYEPEQPDRGYSLLFYPKLNINDDDGLEIGGGYNYNKFSFRAAPSQYSLSFYGSFATKPQSYSLELTGDFYSILDFTKLSFFITGSTLEFTNYFGFGNETDYVHLLNHKGFYRIHQEVFKTNINSSTKLLKYLFFDIGAVINFSNISYKDNSFVAALKNKPFGIGKLWIANIYSRIIYDTRDNKNHPFQGQNFDFEVGYFPELFRNNTRFTKIRSNLSSYVTFQPVTFALRCGGEKNFGEYPFFFAAFLGGEDNLRGYSRQRFSGDASLFGQAEIRTFIKDIKIIIPAKFGVHFLFDFGRVFDNSESEKWHSDYGAGCWISVVNRAVTLSFTYSRSEEKDAVYFKTSMMF